MKTVLERIWAKVDRRGPDECWIWSGGVGQKGQPQMQVKGRTVSPRRPLWEDAHGEILPSTRLVSNTCGVFRCLNPAHFVLRPFRDDEARFWSFVKRAEGDACWEWQGYYFHRKAYGGIKMNGKMLLAHRVAWELTYGQLRGHVAGDAEREICVLHRCDNTRCVRPDHLFLGSDAENVADMHAKGRGRFGANTEAKYVGDTARLRARRNAGLMRERGQRGADTRKRQFAKLPSDTSREPSKETNG